MQMEEAYFTRRVWIMEVLWRWCCIAGGISPIMRRRGAMCERVRDGIPTVSIAHSPSHGSWLGEGFPPSGLWFSHWSPCRIARWGFLSGWEINTEKWWMIFLKCMRSWSSRNTRDVTLCHTVPPECRCLRCRHSITKLQKGPNTFSLCSRTYCMCRVRVFVRNHF